MSRLCCQDTLAKPQTSEPAHKLTLYTVFTLGQNMFSLIRNETCFTIKIVHIRLSIDRIVIDDVFILKMTETTSKGCMSYRTLRYMELV